jgi:ComF family protein
VKHPWTKSLLNFFYPNRCPGCGTLLTARELVCEACGEEMVIGQDDYCHVCGKVVCVCKHRSFAYDRAVVCTGYHGCTVPAVIAMKESANTNFAYFTAGILAERIRYSLIYGQPDCVMPVPMHRSKERMRGYNQASLIGRELAALLEIPFRDDVLYKNRTKRAQHTLNAQERARNVGSFGIRNTQVDGLRILLCDDVLTTGSTMNRCAELLKEHGAEAVIAAAAATTIPRKQEEAT